jgi:hypothetical protein
MTNYIIQDFYIQQNIGKSKYVLSYFAGKRYDDNSKFYDVRIFKSKKTLNNFIKNGSY